MSMDRSLKGANTLIRHRNVLTRAERLDKLAEDEKWSDKESVFGLPKVAHRKQTLAKSAKEPAADAAAGATPAAGAAATPGAPAAKGAAPAAGKGAAPAAKGAAPAKAAAPAAKGKK
jgi:small basic protein (TIGR04137 family)